MVLELVGYDVEVDDSFIDSILYIVPDLVFLSRISIVEFQYVDLTMID